MTGTPAKSADEYLKQLPEDRRVAMARIRELVKKSLPRGYEERAGFGMITYEVPLERFPQTYNGQPLCYIGLASQKNHMALYLMGVYGDAERESFLKEAFRKAGKKLDMGKSCIRFRKVEDLPLDAIATVIAGMPPDELIARHEEVHGARKAAKSRAAKGRAANRGAAKKGAANRT